MSYDKNTIIGYQKLINLLKNTSDQPSKIRANVWVEINDDVHGTYDTNSQVKFKTTILKLRLDNYRDAYIFG